MIHNKNLLFQKLYFRIFISLSLSSLFIYAWFNTRSWKKKGCSQPNISYDAVKLLYHFRFINLLSKSEHEQSFDIVSGNLKYNILNVYLFNSWKDIKLSIPQLNISKFVSGNYNVGMKFFLVIWFLSFYQILLFVLLI